MKILTLLFTVFIGSAALAQETTIQPERSVREAQSESTQAQNLSALAVQIRMEKLAYINSNYKNKEEFQALEAEIIASNFNDEARARYRYLIAFNDNPGLIRELSTSTLDTAEQLLRDEFSSNRYEIQVAPGLYMTSDLN